MKRGAAFAAILAALTAGQAAGCELPGPWRGMQPSDGSVLTGALYLQAVPAPVSGPFDGEVRFCPPIAAAAIGRVQVDAMMPAHQHGMNYRAVVSPNGPGAFTISGLVFHMPGVWEITVSAYAGQQVTHFTLEVPAQ